MKTNSRKLGVLTSGGDAPGMNACIRAVVRTASYYGMQVVGFKQGYSGLVHNDYIDMDNRSVSNIIQRGGTILRSARCMEFKTEDGRQQAADNLTSLGLDTLLVIGGDGSLRGADLLSQQWDGNVIGLPGTIDNDLYGTDHTIGFFTALDTAQDAIDKIRDTADSFDRIFLVEVMGRMAGFIAQCVGVGGGAEEILVPEQKIKLESICEHIAAAKEKGKVSYIIVVAEGAWDGGAISLANDLQNRTGLECRPCVLGHIQRGGSPSTLDRLLATKLGAYAVEMAIENQTGVMVGECKHDLVMTPLEQTYSNKKPLNEYLSKIHTFLVQ
ncbi:MAG: 6-phosphofructokinase [Desulfobacteraceae bacterium]|nr:6-phosphofructokinase [Desulfobacteraceae bacterium]